jgi:hypothetical protein
MVLMKSAAGILKLHVTNVHLQSSLVWGLVEGLEVLILGAAAVGSTRFHPKISPLKGKLRIYGSLGIVPTEGVIG